MNVLKSVETTIANLVEGTFGRLFRSEVRPMELARKLAREMDEHRTMSVSRVYAPNEYSVWLSPEDRARYEGVEHEVIDELCAYLLEHARREKLILAAQPDDRPSTPTSAWRSANSASRRSWSARAVTVSEPERAAPRRARAGGRARRDDDLQHLSARARTGRGGAGTAPGACAARRWAGAGCRCRPRGATIGRSRDCDIVLEDAGISRSHAEIRPDADGWTVADLGSTNGVRAERPRGSRRRSRCTRATASSSARRRSSSSLDDARSTPVSVALKFGFLAVLYLFLLWVARSARRDLRAATRAGGAQRGRAAPPIPADATGLHSASARRAAPTSRTARRSSSSSARRGTSRG